FHRSDEGWWHSAFAWLQFVETRTKKAEMTCEAMREGAIDYRMEEKDTERALTLIARDLHFNQRPIGVNPSELELRYGKLLDFDQFTIIAVHRHFEERREQFERLVTDEFCMILCPNKMLPAELNDENCDGNTIHRISVLAMVRIVGTLMIHLFRISEKMFFQSSHRRFGNPDHEKLVRHINKIVNQLEDLASSVSTMMVYFSMIEEEAEMTKRYVDVMDTLKENPYNWKDTGDDGGLQYNDNVVWRAFHRLKNFSVTQLRDVPIQKPDHEESTNEIIVQLDHMIEYEWIKEPNLKPTRDKDVKTLKKMCNAKIVDEIFHECTGNVEDSAELLEMKKEQQEELVERFQPFVQSRCEWPMIVLEPKMSFAFNGVLTVFNVDIGKTIYDQGTPQGRTLDGLKEIKSLIWKKNSREQSFFHREPTPVTVENSPEPEETNDSVDDEQEEEEFELPPDLKQKASLTSEKLTIGQLWEREWQSEFSKEPERAKAREMRECVIVHVDNPEEEFDFDINLSIASDYQEFDLTCPGDLGPEGTVDDYKKELHPSLWHHILPKEMALPECLVFETKSDDVYLGQLVTLAPINGRTRMLMDMGNFPFPDWWSVRNKRKSRNKVSLYVDFDVDAKDSREWHFSLTERVDYGRKIVPVRVDESLTSAE
ncbi:hypothetical protein PFISCL1PPCAC_28037, partial [Pristionchus fissidentatus]